MNFFKKRKAAKESAKNATVILEPADFNGGPYLAREFFGGILELCPHGLLSYMPRDIHACTRQHAH